MRKPVLEAWHDFFTHHTRKGKSLEQIKSNLVHHYGYEKDTVDALGHHYVKKDRKSKTFKIAVALLIYIFVIASFFTYIYLKPSVTGMVPYGFGRTFYVDASDGSDSNSGLSSSTPIRTISKVNTLNLAPGDMVLFKRGESWRLPSDAFLSFKSGSDSGYVLYGAYGSGPKPEFLGSNISTRTSDWVSQGGNIWRYDHTLVFDVANLAFGNGEFGWRNWSLGEISYDGQGHYYFDRNTNVLYLYSTSNPVDHYGSIEVVFDNSVIELWNKHHIIIENLSLKYSGETGINTDGSFLIIRNNDVSYIGGGFCFSGCNGNQRWGNGIQLWRGAHDVVVEHNRVWEIYDVALTQQGTAGVEYDAYNIVFSHNIVWNSEYGFEYFMDNAASSVINMSVDHNTFYNMGETWGFDQRINTVWARCLRSGNSLGVARQIEFTNNICYLAKQYVYGFMSEWEGWESDSNLYMDHNLLYRDTSSGLGPFFAMWLPLGRSYNTFEEFKSATGKEQNSASGNPQFTDASNLNFMPREGSMACTLGEDGSYVGAIPCTGSVPSNSAPTHDRPRLAASDSPLNTTDATLNCYNVSTADADGDAVVNSYRWYKNAGLVSGLTSSSVSPASTSTGESWVCQVTPYDGTTYGTAKNSTALTIRSTGSQNSSEISVCQLEDASWNEDESLISAFALSTCFDDPQGQTLSYSVSGNSSINVQISTTGIVNLSAPTDWHGSESVAFTARAGSRQATTNAFSLTVFNIADCGDSVCEESESCNSCSMDCGECKRRSGGGGGGSSRPSRTPTLVRNTSQTTSRNITVTPVLPTNTTVESTSVPIAQGVVQPNVTQGEVVESGQQAPTEVVRRNKYSGSILFGFILTAVAAGMYYGYRRLAEAKLEAELSPAPGQEAQPIVQQPVQPEQPPAQLTTQPVDTSAEQFNTQLSTFIEAAAARGYTRAQVKSDLLAAGWPADVIDAFVTSLDSKFKQTKEVEQVVADGVQPPAQGQNL